MGNHRSGKPPSREKLEQALAAVADGVMSLRTASKHFDIDRTTLAKYRDGAFIRRRERRCPSCGSIVWMPCLRCSSDVLAAEQAAKKRRLARAQQKATA
jgi:ribosomal protein S27AE